MKALVAIFALLGSACVAAPSIDGAPCPCPANYYCDSASNMCMPGSLGANRDPGNGGNSPGPSNPNSPAAMPPPSNTPASPLPVACTPVASNFPLRLSASEYRFTVADLLGVELAPSELPPEDEGSSGYTNSIDRTDTEAALRGLAKLVAERARPKLTRPASCVASLGDEACGQAFIESFGTRAFRGPFTDLERAPLSAALATGLKAGGLTGGMTAVVEAALGQDLFLRRRETAASKSNGTNKLVALDPHALAARLAATLWRSSPDETLLAAAQSGALVNAQELGVQARRMLEDPRAERMMRAFFREWLDVNERALSDNAPMLGGYNNDLRAALLRSFDAGAGELVFRQDVPRASLFTTPESWANPALASFYGLAAPAGTGYEPVTTRDASQIRRGLLTTPAFIASHSSDLDTRPLNRSTAVLRGVFCADLPPPPPGVSIPNLPEPAAGTTRQRLEQHRAPSCTVCHQLIDPIGFGLENYDGVGRWRLTDEGRMIDAAAKQPEIDDVPEMSFTGPADLTAQIAASPGARKGYVRQWFRYAFGRKDDPSVDGCTLEAIDKALVAGGDKTKAMLLGLVLTPAFSAMPAPPVK